MNKTEFISEISKLVDEYKPINRAPSGEIMRLRKQCDKYRQKVSDLATNFRILEREMKALKRSGK